MRDSPTERDDEGGWTRLRGRKVVQWGLAYAAGTWALLPVAIVVAWYHRDHVQQRVSGEPKKPVVVPGRDFDPYTRPKHLEDMPPEL